MNTAFGGLPGRSVFMGPRDEPEDDVGGDGGFGVKTNTEVDGPTPLKYPPPLDFDPEPNP
jgi:hypothetical protein